MIIIAQLTHSPELCFGRAEHKEKSSRSTENYTEATDESWDELYKWTGFQEKLRQAILGLMELL